MSPEQNIHLSLVKLYQINDRAVKLCYRTLCARHCFSTVTYKSLSIRTEQIAANHWHGLTSCTCGLKDWPNICVSVYATRSYIVEATVLSNMILLQDIAFDMNKIHETSISINMTKQNKTKQKIINSYNQWAEKAISSSCKQAAQHTKEATVLGNMTLG